MKTWLKGFALPTQDQEEAYLNTIRRTCYTTWYPFRVLAGRGLEELRFEAVTIFYGGNGSGKSTLLNLIADKLGLERESPGSRSEFFDRYVSMCRADKAGIPPGSRMITSDDVFNHMLDMRRLNLGINRRRQELFDDWVRDRSTPSRMTSMADYEELSRVVDSRRMTQSEFVRRRLGGNVPEHSNGESAFIYFNEKIQDNALYLLDEPENSLSPVRQLELARFLEDSARFYDCQLVLATHSLFLLAMRGARVYDLDDSPARVKDWTELENVRAYHRFFQEHSAAFGDG
ncbi:MAG: AAA family ATPase [Clostridia bacterium]|nr:AAA family ATPase [Clostridia bacterium]